MGKNPARREILGPLAKARILGKPPKEQSICLSIPLDLRRQATDQSPPYEEACVCVCVCVCVCACPFKMPVLGGALQTLREIHRSCACERPRRWQLGQKSSKWMKGLSSHPGNCPTAAMRWEEGYIFVLYQTKEERYHVPSVSPLLHTRSKMMHDSLPILADSISSGTPKMAGVLSESL